MSAALAILQWILLLGILVIAFRHSYRAGRITAFSICFTWALLTLQMAAFSAYAGSLAGVERDMWADHFPEGQHFMAAVLTGWLNGLIVAALAVGVRRVIGRKQVAGVAPQKDAKNA